MIVFCFTFHTFSLISKSASCIPRSLKISASVCVCMYVCVCVCLNCLSECIALPTKVHQVKGMVFPVVMHGCESWTIKKAECWRIIPLNCGAGEDSQESLIARRSNQSILKEINPEYSLEGLMLKLKLCYFGHLIQKANSLEKTLMLRKTEGRRKRGQQSMRPLDGSRLLRELVKDREAWCAAVHGVIKGQVWLSDWTTTAIRMHPHILSQFSRVWLHEALDYSPPASSILAWVAMPSSRRPSLPRNWTYVSYVSYIGRWVLYQ